MMFDKPVALNRETHRQLLFKPTGAYRFAAALHSVPLCASEFFAAAKEYAIVFARAKSGEAIPIVVLGLRRDENLFVTADGRWDARYVPSFVRSYPFGLAEPVDGGGLQVLIDAACPGFDGTAGIALFGDGGVPSPELQERLNFLQAQQHDVKRTQSLAAELDRLGLLIPRNAQLQIKGREEMHLNDFLVVDESKFGTLNDGELLNLARNGSLSLITAHLLSISNLVLLGSRLQPKSTDPDDETTSTPPLARSAPPRPTQKSKARDHAKS